MNLRNRKPKKVNLTGPQILRYAAALTFKQIAPALEEFGKQVKALVKRSEEYEKAKRK